MGRCLILRLRLSREIKRRFLAPRLVSSEDCGWKFGKEKRRNAQKMGLDSRFISWDDRSHSDLPIVTEVGMRQENKVIVG